MKEDEIVTKKLARTTVGELPGEFVDITTEALSSVEVGEDAKGTLYVKSSKAYHADPTVAATAAVEALKTADAALRELRQERLRGLEEANPMIVDERSPANA